jgi:hypothetical protein
VFLASPVTRRYHAFFTVCEVGILSFGKDSVVGLLIEIQTLPAFISNYFGGYKTTWLAAQNLY